MKSHTIYIYIDQKISAIQEMIKTGRIIYIRKENLRSHQSKNEKTVKAN